MQFRRFANNRVSASVAENGAVTEFTYTPEGRVRTVLTPPGASESRLLTTYTYDRRGRTTSAGDFAHSNPTTNVWSIHGELLSIGSSREEKPGWSGTGSTMPTEEYCMKPSGHTRNSVRHERD